MDGKSRGELILFPKTIDYYQIELTKLLEKEAYGEAIRTLEFLVSCRTDDGRTNEEWSTLLEWLRTEFPDAARADEDGDDEDPIAEADLLRSRVSQKAARDKQYAKRLLESLSRGSLEAQLHALEQLALLDDESAAGTLLKKLSDPQVHPFVAFKLLQTLAKLGIEGEATFGKLGEIVTVDIERTPAGPDRFPEPLPFVADRVREMAETDDPTISIFAKQTWEEFLIYVYGTTLYNGMHEMDEQGLDVWASALHTAVAHAMYGGGTAEELQDRYGITDSLLPAWEGAYASLAKFFRDVSGVRV
ncbi:hypothetical protein [Paenibacillus sp.]|uniref:hypothetical protein n=1 Tax=Paenibacillus sp. TaxID=58172 RepID=UPI0028126561|nr:hypothetical protein [Paenibacillus sp.]